MHKEIIVNSTTYEVRIAILEDKELVELLIERAETRRMVGDIYKGVVTAVLPGIQAAFVDIGHEKAAFLHVSDLVDMRDEGDLEIADRYRGEGQRALPPIQDVLQKGEEILVQVTKEPIATKGPRITTQISLPGRYAVIMPNADHMGVSRKIEDRNERTRLKQMVRELKPQECALIVRTVGEGVERKSLENDVSNLVAKWERIKEKAGPAEAPSLVHQDVGLVIGLMRDIFNEDVNQLILDNRDAYDELMGYLKDIAPQLRQRVKLYNDPMPVFDRYGIENEIDKTMDRKVWLKKGGYLIIQQTEALVSVDVNTGRFTGRKNQEETIFKTNMLAAREMARQLRLRDIGGIIVIDFIDMESEGNKKRLLQEFRTWLKRDRAKTKAFQVSDLGLIEMSRQRVRPSLYHFMSDQCHYCDNTGHILSLDSILLRIERMARRVSHYTQDRDVRLHANPRVTLFLREDRWERLQELMDETGVSLDLVDDPRLHREEFRLISIRTGEDLMRQVSSMRPSNTQRAPATTESGDDQQRSTPSRDTRPRRRPVRSRGGRRNYRADEGHNQSRSEGPQSDGRSEGRAEERSDGRSGDPSESRSNSRYRNRGGNRTDSRVGQRSVGSRDGRDAHNDPGADPRSNEPTPPRSEVEPGNRREEPGNEYSDADGNGDQGQRPASNRSRGPYRRRRGSRGRGQRSRPFLEDNPQLSVRGSGEVDE